VVVWVVVALEKLGMEEAMETKGRRFSLMMGR
jgi:hypothetical protein